MRSTWARCGCCVAVCLLQFGVSVAADAIENSPMQPRTALPGALMTLSIDLSDLDAVGQRFQESLDLPTGWRNLLPLERIDALNEPLQQRTLLIQIPEQAEPGLYPLDYRLHSVDRSYHVPVSVQIQPQARFHIVAEAGLDAWVQAGDTAFVQLRIFNFGNIESDLQIKHHASVPSSVVIDLQQVRVPAQSYQDVSIQVTPDAALESPTFLNLRLSFEDLDGVPVTQWRHRMEVIPRVAGADPMLRYPMFLRTTLRHQTQWTQQWAWSGSGFLDEGQHHQVSFAAQWSQSSRHGAGLDRFWLRYQHKHYRLRMGDQLFQLSPLTLPARVGRGAGVDLTPSAAWQAGSFWVSSLHKDKRSEVVAGYWAWSPHADWQFRVNAFSQRETDAVQRTERLGIWSVETTYRRSQQTFWQVELAHSAQENNLGYAARLDAASSHRGPLGLRRARLRLTYAEPDFAGSQSNQLDAYVTATVPLRSGLRSRWSYRYLNRNVSSSPTLGPLITEQRWTSDWSWTLSEHWQFELGYQRHQLQGEVMNPPSVTHLGRVGLSYRQPQWRWQVRLDPSVTSAQSNDRLRYAGFVGVHYLVRPHWQFRAHARWSQQHVHSFDTQLSERREVNLLAQWQPTPSWVLFGSYRFGDTFDSRWSVQQLHQSWSIESQHQWAQQHQVSAQWRHWVSSQQKRINSFELSYGLRWSPPLRHRPSVGSLVGQVLLQTETAEQPIANALVRVKDQAVFTDSRGLYVIRSLPAGTHEVRVFWPDQSGDVQLSNQQIAVLPGQNHELTTVIQQPGAIAGRLFLPSDDDVSDVPSLLRPQGSMSSILVRVDGAEQSHQVTVQPDGRFSLMGLSAGDWQVSIVADTLPSRTHALQRSQRVQVKPGETSSVEFHLHWVRPSIVVHEHGEIVLN